MNIMQAVFLNDRIKDYKNEILANEAFKELRLKEGIHCKKCGYTEHYWLKSKEQFQCKSCRFRTTLKSGSVLEGCKLPVSYFFITIYLLIKKENKVSIEDIKSFTEHKYYEPLWDFLKKMKDYKVKSEQRNPDMDFASVVYNYFEEYKTKN